MSESLARNFDRVEEEIAKLHSYDTFVLRQVPVTRVSKRADKWWREATKAEALIWQEMEADS